MFASRYFYLFSLINLLNFVTIEGAGYRWNFGANVVGSVLAEQKTGTIGIFEKLTEVTLNTPPCTKLIFVTVDVNNYINPPEVMYDEPAGLITIKYTLLQSSYSSYKIASYAIPTPYCGSRPNVHRPHNFPSLINTNYPAIQPLKYTAIDTYE